MKSLIRLKFLFIQYEMDCKNYSLKSSANDFIVKKQSDLIDAFNGYFAELELMDKIIADDPYKELIEVIRKQAMIIEAAGIIYPTINQDIRTIQDYYLISQDRIDEVGKQSIDNTLIKVI